MPEYEKETTEQQRLEKEQLEDLGTVWRTRGPHAIHCLTVIGQIEGHVEAPQGQKTTKYEHVIPQLVAVQEDPAVEGLLVLINTVGGDVEAGLALAELIASISKPMYTTGIHRTAAYKNRGEVHSCRRHYHTGNYLVAVRDKYDTVKGVCRQHNLDTVADKLTGRKRISHTSVVHCKAVAHADGKELKRNAARVSYTVLDLS